MRTNSASDTSTFPFLNDYKRNFFFKRLLQTIIGGPIFIFNSTINAPVYIYIFQIFFLILPFLFGGISILIHDLINTDKWNLYTSIIAGCIYFFIILFLKMLTLIIVNKSNEKKDKKNVEKQNRLNDEQNFEFGNLFSKSTVEFLIPTSSEIIVESDSTRMTITKKIIKTILKNLFDSCVAGFLMFSSVYLESIVYLKSFYSLAPSIILFILHWIVLTLSFYSLCFRNPPEIAVYRSYDNLNLNQYYRIFYVLLFQLIELIYK